VSQSFAAGAPGAAPRDLLSQSRGAVGVDVQRISRAADFLRLEAEWNALADSSPNPLLRHDWFTTYATAFCQGQDLAIYLARIDGRLRAAAPMVVERVVGFPALRFLGSRETLEPEAFLYDDPRALEALCRALIASGRPLGLTRLDNESPELALLIELAQGRGVVSLRRSSSQTHSTYLKPDRAALEASMPSRKRAVIRKQRRYLEQRGAVTFDVAEPDEHGFDAAFDEFVAVEAASWKQRNGSSIAASPRYAGFMRGYARAAARSGRLRLAFLRLDGKAIAAQMDVEQGGRLWGLKSGADEAWSKYGPGVLSFHELACWGGEQGLSRREHLGRAETWQTRWPSELRSQTSFRFYPWRVGAAVVFANDALVFARYRLQQRRAKAADAG
jgi:CelD/BcsL family acetyltransferase involved in cellulose biosynthesis